MDATLKSIPLDIDTIRNIVNDIIQIDLDDEITFELLDIIDIREEDEYGGFKINIIGHMENLKIYIALELTTGDKITPREITYNYNCIFDDKKIPIMAYTIETLLAEKLQTVISRGVLNTRMKDFYDIYMLVNYNLDKINIDTLKMAIKNTFEYRNTNYDHDYMLLQINEIQNDNDMQNMWKNYKKSAIYAKGIEFEQVIGSINKLLEIIYT